MGLLHKKNGWFDRCDSEKWELFVDTCPQDAKNCKELPNWARNLLGVKHKKGRHDHAKVIPHAVSQAVEMLIMHALSDGQEVTSAAVAKTIQWGVSVYNDEVKFVNRQVQKHNETLLQELRDGEYEFRGQADVGDICQRRLELFARM